MWINNRISRQVMALVFISFSLFFMSATFIIGYQYYNDLETLIYDRTDSAARLFKSEFESDIRRTEHALSNFGLNETVIDIAKTAPPTMKKYRIQITAITCKANLLWSLRLSH